MNEELQARAEAAAEQAECTRCKVRILADESKTGMVFGRLFVPLAGSRHTFQLCGKCGLALREFLFPHLLDDATYAEIKRLLLTEHWV